MFELLQFSDSLFPSGAYAHSFGLESWVETGKIKTKKDVKRLLDVQLERQLKTRELPALLHAYRSESLAVTIKIDRLLLSHLVLKEPRQACLSMGQRTLKIFSELYDALHGYRRALSRGQTPGCYPVVWGAMGNVLGISAAQCATAYVYGHVAAIAGAATRLIPLGNLEAQWLIAQYRCRVRPLIQAAQRIELDALGSFTPELDLAAMAHERAHSRMFQS